MVWAYVLAGSAGFLLGLRYRIPALFVASALLMAASPVATAWGVLQICEAIVMGFGALVVLQGGYLAGLTLQSAEERIS